MLDGRVNKLPRIRFDYDSEDLLKPWRLRSDRVDLTFVPFLDRVASTNLLLIRSTVHQLFGRYEGTVLTDQGELVEVEGLIGWAEEHRARW